MAADDTTAPGGRTPRSAAMQAMVDATVQLLQERSPDRVTIRDIAKRSGHHHRFVAGWFGSKVGLFRAAFDQMAEAAADALVLEVPERGTGPRPPIVQLLHLMSWLAAAEPDILQSERTMLLIARVSEVYQEQFGVSGDVARISAQRIAGYFLVTVLFPGPLGVREGDFDAHLELEAWLAGALASRPPAT